jgi:glucoamylase
MEGLASSTGLLPEQSWDRPDLPNAFMFFGRPTGSAMPLMWAHAEYIKLLRSTRDSKVWDLIPDVAKRYLDPATARGELEIWKPMRQVKSVQRGFVFRVQAPGSFRLHWTVDEWQTVQDTDSSGTTLGVEYVDIPTASGNRIRFTFFWHATDSWEGRDYEVEVSVR